MKIAVLGGGNAGFAFAGHLAMLGHEIRLYEAEEFGQSLRELAETGEILCEGVIAGRGKLKEITTETETALCGAELVIIAVPAFAQDLMFERCIPYLEDGQTIVFFPSNYAALKNYVKLKSAGLEERVTIAEADSIPYAARKQGDGRVLISGFKERLYLSAIPSSKNETVLRMMNEALYPIFTDGHNAIFSSLNNTNCVLHCTAAILNSGWIERTKGNFSFYSDGMTPAVCRVMEALEKEIIQISLRFGPRICTQREFFHEYYGIPMRENLYDMIQQSVAHAGIKSPQTLDSRYLSEDVPYGLVPAEALAEMLDIDTPMISGLILMADTLNGTDYRSAGMTAEALGIRGLRTEEILKLVR